MLVLKFSFSRAGDSLVDKRSSCSYSLVPSTNIKGLTTAYNISSRGLTPSSGLPGNDTKGIHAQAHAHTHIHMNEKKS